MPPICTYFSNKWIKIVWRSFHSFLYCICETVFILHTWKMALICEFLCIMTKVSKQGNIENAFCAYQINSKLQGCWGIENCLNSVQNLNLKSWEHTAAKGLDREKWDMFVCPTSVYCHYLAILYCTGRWFQCIK